MLDRETLIAQLASRFPPEEWHGEAAPHGCEECFLMSNYLRGKSWVDVSDSFIDEFNGSLPLLSDAAYCAFLPAWLHWCIVEPKRPAANLLLVNLSCQEEVSHFTATQKWLVREAADFIIRENGWGEDDEGNVEAREQILQRWGS